MKKDVRKGKKTKLNEKKGLKNIRRRIFYRLRQLTPKNIKSSQLTKI